MIRMLWWGVILSFGHLVLCLLKEAQGYVNYNPLIWFNDSVTYTASLTAEPVNLLQAEHCQGAIFIYTNVKMIDYPSFPSWVEDKISSSSELILKLAEIDDESLLKTYTFEYTTLDTNAVATETNYTLSVTIVNSPPTFTPDLESSSITALYPISFTTKLSDPENDPILYSLQSANDTLSNVFTMQNSNNTLTLEWIPK
jgi:hypothetical protein